MNSESPPDLAQEIVTFLESLPATISTEVLLFVMLYALDDDSSARDPSTFLPKLREALVRTGGLKRMSATIRTVAAIDYVLARSAEKIRTAEVIMKSASLRQELRDRLLAGYPLRQKHYDKVLDDWRKIRTTRITHQDLSDYEDRLLMPRRATPNEE